MADKMRWLTNVRNCCGSKFYPEPENMYHCCDIDTQIWMDSLRKRGFIVELRPVDDDKILALDRPHMFALWANVPVQTKS